MKLYLNLIFNNQSIPFVLGLSNLDMVTNGLSTKVDEKRRSDNPALFYSPQCKRLSMTLLFKPYTKRVGKRDFLKKDLHKKGKSVNLIR